MNSMTSEAKAGFTYTVDVLRPDGSVTQQEVIHNLMPKEGLDHLIAIGFKQAVQMAAWYIALFEGNYTPTPDTKAATFVAEATECTAYTPAARVEFVEGAVADGYVDNAANRAEFTFTADKTIYGGAMLSASPKGATTGVCMSAVRFASPKVVEVGDVLRVTAGNSLVSA